jgi:hypothetical protein
MLGDMYAASDVANMRAKRADRGAANRWRFRGLKTKEQVLLTSVVTSVLGLFLR